MEQKKNTKKWKTEKHKARRLIKKKIQKKYDA